MTLDLSLPLKALGRPLQESIRELRRGYQTVSECLEQALADCDQRGVELSDCRRQLAEARRSLSECERQLAERARGETELSNRCTALKKQHDAKQAELASATERITQLQADGAQNKQRLELQTEQCEQLRNQITRLETDSRESHEALAQLRGQFAPLAETAAEAARLRGELAAAQCDVARFREQAAAPVEDAALQAQLAALDAERRQLQGELESAKGRAAELGASLVEAQRLAAAERDRWSEDLAHMRQLLERQSEAWSRHTAQSGDDAAAIAAIKEQLLRSETELVQGRERLQMQLEQNEQLREEIRRLETARESARDELSQLRGQFAPLAENAAEAARLRGELAASQQEVTRLRDQAANGADAAELEQQLCTAQNERQQMQGELEATRQRAATLADSLAEAQRLAATEREAWSDELKQLRETLERQSQAWSEKAGQLGEQAGAAAASEIAAIEARLRDSEAEIARGHQRLQAQLDENEQLRKEAEQLKAAWDKEHSELAAAQAELARLAEQSVEGPEAKALQKQLSAAEFERQQLENELDLLRHRGAELVEQLAEQKRVAATERDSWSEELRQLRKAVELQSEALARRGGPPTLAVVAPEPPTEHPHAASNGTKPENSVLDSVMAQFQTLQNSKVRKFARSKR